MNIGCLTSYLLTLCCTRTSEAPRLRKYLEMTRKICQTVSFTEVKPLSHLTFTRAHSLTHCSLSGYLRKSCMNNAFFVSFFNHVLPDIQNQNQNCLTAESQLAGKNALCHYILAITVVTPLAYQFFWQTRRYKSIYNLKMYTVEMLIHHSKDAFFFSFKTIYDMSCHLLAES
jgi:hypothetical protein